MRGLLKFLRLPRERQEEIYFENLERFQKTYLEPDEQHVLCGRWTEQLVEEHRAIYGNYDSRVFRAKHPVVGGTSKEFCGLIDVPRTMRSGKLWLKKGLLLEDPSVIDAIVRDPRVGYVIDRRTGFMMLRKDATKNDLHESDFYVPDIFAVKGSWSRPR